ncbi:hypothetical protein BCS42_04185 [Crenothrix sp. D3]|jgi:hypothetical protein|nr:hypothetical protein BCS42_04185 [Crenothrix sp. D3]
MKKKSAIILTVICMFATSTSMAAGKGGVGASLVAGLLGGVNVGQYQQMTVDSAKMNQTNASGSTQGGNVIDVNKPTALVIQRYEADNNVDMNQRNSQDSVQTLNGSKTEGPINGVLIQEAQMKTLSMTQSATRNSTQAGNYHTDHK